MSYWISIFETAGKYAGFGGLIIAALLLFFYYVLRSGKLGNVPATKTFYLLRLMIICFFVTALIGISAWTYLEVHKSSNSPGIVHVLKKMRIYVKNEQNQPITDARILVDDSQAQPVDTSYGYGDFPIASEKSQVRVRIYHKGKVAIDTTCSVTTDITLTLKTHNNSKKTQSNSEQLPQKPQEVSPECEQILKRISDIEKHREQIKNPTALKVMDERILELQLEYEKKCK